MSDCITSVTNLGKYGLDLSSKLKKKKMKKRGKNTNIYCRVFRFVSQIKFVCLKNYLFLQNKLQRVSFLTMF